MAASLQADDWKFITPTTPGGAVAVELFLNNGQYARLEVFPLVDANGSVDQVPEIVVSCEMPGERLNLPPETKRWISRPPDKDCPWSRVELSPTLIRQINDMLAAAISSYEI